MPTPKQEQRERDSGREAGKPPVQPIQIARDEDEIDTNPGGRPKVPHFWPAPGKERPTPKPGSGS